MLLKCLLFLNYQPALPSFFMFIPQKTQQHVLTTAKETYVLKSVRCDFYNRK